LQPYTHTTGRWRLTLLLVHGGLGSPDSARPSGGDETDLLTGGPTPADCGRLADMLVVTTTVRMLHRVHGHTSHLAQRRDNIRTFTLDSTTLDWDTAKKSRYITEYGHKISPI
jgi:hypothetical protein